MASEHLVCEYCEAEFNNLDAYLEHKSDQHAQLERERQRQLDEESRESFPASDTPSATNPSTGTGDTAEDAVRADPDPVLQAPAPTRSDARNAGAEGGPRQ